MKPKSQSTEIKEMKPERAERPRVAASLDSWLACDWSQGVHLPSLDEFQQVNVCTQNTLYEIIVISRCGEVRVRGGRFFPEWTPARLAGQHGRRKLPQAPRHQSRPAHGDRSRAPPHRHLAGLLNLRPRARAQRIISSISEPSASRAGRRLGS